MIGSDIDIIFFDAGGTLLYPDPPVGEVYSRVARRQGIDADPQEMERVFWRTFGEMPSGPTAQTGEWWEEMVARVVGSFGPIRDLDQLCRDLDAWFHAPDAYSLFPGARETVETLHGRGYRTGLISNWERHLRGILIGLGLIPLLDPAVISAEEGVEKPDPAIYRVALAAAGVEPERAVMVGDTLEADGRGAVDAGMHAVLIGVARTDHPRIHWIETIADLPKLFPESP